MSYLDGRLKRKDEVTCVNQSSNFSLTSLIDHHPHKRIFSFQHSIWRYSWVLVVVDVSDLIASVQQGPKPGFKSTQKQKKIVCSLGEGTSVPLWGIWKYHACYFYCWCLCRRTSHSIHHQLTLKRSPSASNSPSNCFCFMGMSLSQTHKEKKKSDKLKITLFSCRSLWLMFWSHSYSICIQPIICGIFKKFKKIMR